MRIALLQLNARLGDPESNGRALERAYSDALAGGAELVRWVLEWGDKARVVGPPWLRDAVVAELRGAFDHCPEEAP